MYIMLCVKKPEKNGQLCSNKASHMPSIVVMQLVSDVAAALISIVLVYDPGDYQ